MIRQDYLDIPVSGISIDVETGDASVAWDATPPPGLTGPTLLNMATNILYNCALNASGNTAGTPSIIMANYASFSPITGGSLTDLKWIAFFEAPMVSRRRPSIVHALIRFLGCVSCILFVVHLKGATIVCSSDAVFEWCIRPDWSLARPLTLGFYRWRYCCYNHHHRVRCCF